MSNEGVGFFKKSALEPAAQWLQGNRTGGPKKKEGAQVDKDETTAA
jgi:hypothetical protein